METLIELTKHQVACYDEIAKMKTNYNKDPKSRKTSTYLETRLARLEHLWGELTKRDIVIQEYREANPQHNYFAKRYYEEIGTVYENFKDILQQKLDEVEKEEKQAAELKKQREEAKALAEHKAAEAAAAAKATQKPATESRLDVHDKLASPETDNYSSKMIRVQLETIRLLDRLIHSLSAEEGQIHSPFHYQHKLNTIQAYWNKITLNHTDIVANPNSMCDEYLQQQSYEELEDRYHNAVIKLQEHLGTTQRSDEEVKLPRLVIPVFEGDYQTWPSFHDIFVRLIHNNTRLGEAEKMQYLKTHVRKEASSLLQHLSISNANYRTAWQLLTDRFNNKRKLFTVQLQILLSQPKLENESAIGIRKLHDTTRECLHALSNLGIDTTTWAPFITHIIIHKLDIVSHKLYEQNLEKPRELPTYDGLFRFLENRFQSLETLKDSKKKDATSSPKSNQVIKQQQYSRYKAYHTIAGKGKSIKCSYCHQSHKLYQCQKFLALSTLEKRQFIQTNKLCVNCLMHMETETCRSKYNCIICQKHHHTLLHQGLEDCKQLPKNTTAHISTTKSTQVNLSRHNRNVLLATALVKARTIDGRWELLRALIDPGSQASFISESAAQLLALPRIKAKAEVSGLGMTNSGTVRYKLMLEIFPHFPSTFAMKIEALILPQLTKLLPDKKLANYNGPDQWSNTLLADPTYDTPGPIDVIIGADVFSSIICDGIKKLETGLVGQKTEFGWILSGPTECQSISDHNQITSMVSFMDLDKTLKRFWEIEDADPTSVVLSEDDKSCEEHYVNTHQRSPDGSYTVRIPFKKSTSELGDSRRRALARLYQAEKKFQINKKLETEYKAFMHEYITLGHMVPAPRNSAGGYYLPHQAVIKEDSSTTKLRVVFDASSKTTTGISLNDIMYIGQKLQPDLTDLILRWRKHRYVFTADIEKMYRQIKIHPKDQHYQKILWRASTQEPVKEYHLTTVTYGMAFAPFLAIRTLRQLAQDGKNTYPEASRILATDFYVDDLMTGAASICEAKTIQRELNKLLAIGGFKLRKWTANQ